MKNSKLFSTVMKPKKKCDSKLSKEYKKLKLDIDVVIQKFNVAYSPVEVNGTKK